MALLFMDGFDAGDFAQKWAIGGSVSSITTGTRFGVGRALNCTGTGSFAKRSIPASNRIFFGYAYSNGTGTSGNSDHFRVYGDNGSVCHVAIRWEGGTNISVWRGINGTALATGLAQEALEPAHCYVEGMVYVHDTAGQVQIKVNGVLVLDFTGDTKNGGVGNPIDAVMFTRPNNQIIIDDFYLCDDTGTSHNTFLGDSRVYTVVPTGAGASTGLTPTTAPNWGTVDELPYSATDYVAGGTAGLKDTYAMGDIPGSISVVHAVQTNAIALKSDTGARSLRTVLRSGSTDYVGSTVALGTAASTVTTTYAADPATSAAWTRAAVNNAEAGAEVV